MVGHTRTNKSVATGSSITLEEQVKIENMAKSERERREEALSSLGGEVEGAAREIQGRDLKQMLSVRMEADLIAELREMADKRGVKVSDLVREAVAKLVSEYELPTIQIRSLTISQSASLKPIITMSGKSPIEGQRNVAYSSGNPAS